MSRRQSVIGHLILRIIPLTSATFKSTTTQGQPSYTSDANLCTFACKALVTFVVHFQFPGLRFRSGHELWSRNYPLYGAQRLDD